ncbi:MAG: DMT family protein [Pseudobdellovibrio sp.]
MFQQLIPISFLAIANIFMTFAWYGHLKNLKEFPLWQVILISWSIAFVEYCFQVPANRLGSEYFSLPQLKIIQEVITLIIFVGFSFWYMKIPLKLDFLWAGLCMLGAVYFVFRS